MLRRQFASGADTMAENKIAEWLRKGGADNLKGKGEKLKIDLHQSIAHSMGLKNDYTHSKILKDNNFIPESIQRRSMLDESWSNLKGEIQTDYQRSSLTVEEYTKQCRLGHNKFRQRIEDLDKLAKKVNDAIISDSLRFNGRAPVKHARRFKLDERIKEGILDNLLSSGSQN